MADQPHVCDTSPHATTRRSARNPAPRRILTETVFFPAAAVYGAVAVPLSAHGIYGGWAPAGLSTPVGHAHELFFGYALAVVTGFLINRVSRSRMLLLIGLWLTARILFLSEPGSPAAFAANAGFAAAVAFTAAPRFMKAAKKWRNRVIGPLVIAICTVAVAYQAAWLLASGEVMPDIVDLAVVLFALLMLFFGGRLIAPAAAGAIEQAGGHLQARVQPRIEGALLIIVTAGLVLSAMPAGHMPAGIALMTAGVLALVRLGRWQLWLCRRRIDLLCLGFGYAWLGAGLVLVGLDRAFDTALAGNAAVHAITIGALGTLTTNIMARTRLLLIRRRIEAMAPWFVCMTAAMSAAALVRILAPPSAAMMLLAAGLWSLALMTLALLLLRYRKRDYPPQSG